MCVGSILLGPTLDTGRRCRVLALQDFGTTLMHDLACVAAQSRRVQSCQDICDIYSKPASGIRPGPCVLDQSCSSQRGNNAVIHNKPWAYISLPCSADLTVSIPCCHQKQASAYISLTSFEDFTVSIQCFRQKQALAYILLTCFADFTVSIQCCDQKQASPYSPLTSFVDFTASTQCFREKQALALQIAHLFCRLECLNAMFSSITSLGLHIAHLFCSPDCLNSSSALSLHVLLPQLQH